MLFMYGRDEMIRNVYRVSKGASSEPVATKGELRSQYLRFLSDARFEAPVNMSRDIFITDPQVEAAIAAAYSGGGQLDDMDQERVIGASFDDSDRLRRIEKVREAAQHLVHVDPALAEVFDLVIHSVFVKATNRISNGTAAHGGSSSNAIGAIWLSVNEDLSTRDIVELLVHELTHHLLFIDEYCHYHFDYHAIAEPSNFALSAIRNTMRPLDKVVHSIVVAAEVLRARESDFLRTDPSVVKVHPDTPTVARNTLAACDSVLSLPNLSTLMSPRATDLIHRSRAACMTGAAA